MTLLAALLLAAAAMPACTWDHAHYELVGDSRYTVDVVPFTYDSKIQHLNIVLRAHSAASGMTRWYFPDGGSSGLVSLISMEDPTAKDWVPPDPDGASGRPFGDRFIDAFAADGSAAEQRWPWPGKPAAAYFHISYSVLGRAMPDGLFRLTACR